MDGVFFSRRGITTETQRTQRRKEEKKDRGRSREEVEKALRLAILPCVFGSPG
jgi:hypothetical protein